MHLHFVSKIIDEYIKDKSSFTAKAGIRTKYDERNKIDDPEIQDVFRSSPEKKKA